MTEILSELIDFLREVSPSVWQTLVRQVYVEAITYLAVAVVLAFICVVLASRKLREGDYDSYGEFTVILLIVSGSGSFALLVAGAMRLANPEFYAIRYILSQLVGK